MEWFTDSVVVQIIATAGVILAPVVAGYIELRRKLRDVGDDAREARAQTSNDHSDNLRDELDARHNETKETLLEISRDVRGLRLDHLATRKDIGNLHAEDRASRREVQALRQELQAHIDQTGPFMPIVQAMLRKYRDDQQAQQEKWYKGLEDNEGD